MRYLAALSLVIAGFLLAPDRALAAPRVERVASGLNWPVYVTAPPGDTTRVFILEGHLGTIRILRLSDLALRYGRVMWLVADHSIAARGTPTEVLAATATRTAFGLSIHVGALPDGTPFAVPA